MSRQIDEILKKTDDFIRAFYKNKIVKGSIISVTGFILVLLLVDLLEYFAWFDSTVRSILFFGSVIIIGVIIAFYIVIPLLQLLRIGKRISTREAAKIIGKHLPEVNDKLLNAIELLEEAELKGDDRDLIIAGIEQKSKELSPVPFKKAIDKKANKKYLKYFVPIAAVFIVLFLISPAFVREPAVRVINYDKTYQKPLPFKITVLTDSLVCLQNEDFTFKIRVSGDEIPEKIYVETDGEKYLMEELPGGTWQYTFKSVVKDRYFTLRAGKYKSRLYHLKTYPKPVIISYEITLEYPAYLGKKNEILENTTDFIAPEGTKAVWNVYTKDVDRILMSKGEKVWDTITSESNVFRFEEKLKDDLTVALLASNRYTGAIDSLMISVKVVKDEYPKINMARYDEDAFMKKIRFEGDVSDDYGFHDLKFYYRYGKNEKWNNYSLKIPLNTNNFSFEYYISPQDFNLNAGQKLKYYFSVRDNDIMHHFKETRTPTGTIEMPDNDQLEKSIDSTSGIMKEQMNEILKQIEEIKRKIEQNRLNLLNKPDLNWMDRERLKNLLKEEEKLQKELENLKNLKDQIEEIEKLKKEKISEEQKTRLDELKELFDALKDPEFLKKLEKAKKDIEKMNKDELNKMLEDLKKKNEENEDNLKQNEELFKVMEFEKKFKELMSKMDSVSKKMMSESEKNRNKLQKKDTAQKKQQELKKEFEDIKKKLEQIKELNKKLEEPFGLTHDKNLENGIEEELNKASEKLEKRQQKKAADNQQNASEKMKKMKAQLEMSFNNEMSARMGEDAENMKRLLDNLVQLSFDQEKNIELVKTTSKNDPGFVKNIDNLQQIRENFKVINDSLKALSRRNIFIKPFILKESNNIIHSLDRTATALHDRNTGKANTQQQYAMTSMNNLALLLEESLEKMQQSMMNMKSSGKGSQSCPNPGNGKGSSLKDIIGKQKSLSNGMKKMKGKQKGKGSKGSSGENGDSEQLAKMAALQQQIREMLQEYMEQLKAQGGNGNAMNEILKEMLENEKDLVNKNITEESLKRQHDIEVRLLKAEKAELEREKRKERESKEGKNIKRSNQIEKIKYKENKRGKKEVIISNPVKLNPYYKSLHNRYINNLENKKW